MTSIWAWLAIAAMGALHGLNPASGWLFAAARGVRSRDRAWALRSLVPIAVGHAASLAVFAAAVAFGMAIDRVVLRNVAIGLLLVAALAHLSRRTPASVRAPAGRAGLALWSFVVSTLHGSGLMLAPMLIPLCISAAPARAAAGSGPLALALAAVGVHTAAMLIVGGAIAMGVCGAFDRFVRRPAPQIRDAHVEVRPAETSSLGETRVRASHPPTGEPPWPTRSSTSSSTPPTLPPRRISTASCSTGSSKMCRCLRAATP